MIISLKTWHSIHRKDLKYLFNMLKGNDLFVSNYINFIKFCYYHSDRSMKLNMRYF